jgi:hypothetical protein
MQAGRMRWLARLKAAGLKTPCGRKSRGAAQRNKDRRIARAQQIVEEALMVKKKPALPAALPQAEPAAEPLIVGFTDDYLRAGMQALSEVQGWLGIQVDKARLADVEWLRDAENRKIAAILIKLASIQANIALGVISGTIRASDRLPDPEKERSRQRTLDELRHQLTGGDGG